MMLILSFFCAVQASAGVKIVVNASNRVPDRMTKAEVANLFLKRSTRWANGQPVIALSVTDPRLRSDFSETVLERNVDAIEMYWKKMLFSGRAVSPLELSSESDVLAFVEKYPAAIGYVSDTTRIPDGVKVVRLD